MNRKPSRCTAAAAVPGVARRRTTPVRGAPVLARIGEFLPSIPPSGPAVVLGLVAAPVAVEAIAA